MGKEKRIPAFLLLSGFLFILGYFLMASSLGFFTPQTFSTTGGPFNFVPISDDLYRSPIRHFPPWELASIFWKVFLLLPASVCLALYLSVRRLPLLEKFQNAAIFKSSKYLYLLSLLTLLSFIIILLTTMFVLRKTPVTDDENAYLAQAKIMLGGHILAPPPPVEKNFTNTFIITDGSMLTGKYTLGHPALLAVGKALAGTFYAIPILLALLTIWLIYLVGKEMYDLKTGILAAFFLSISPFFLLNASTLLSHAPTLFFLALFTFAFLKGTKRHGAWWGLLTGLAIGAAFNIRQMSALGFALPFVFWLLWRLVSHKEGSSHIPFILSCVAGFAAWAIFTLWYNRLVTGSPFTFPFNYYDPSERLGFGPMLQDFRYTHTPLKGLQNFLVSMGRFNLWFLGVPWSLLFILPVLFQKASAWADRACGVVILTFCIAYIFYYSPGVPDTGPVYYFEMLLPVCLLTARGILLLKEGTPPEGQQPTAENFFSFPMPHLSSFAAYFLAVSLILSLITFLPEKVLYMSSLTEKLREPYELVEKSVEQPALVFIRSLPQAGWVYGYRLTDPYLQGPLLYCRDLGPEKNVDVISHFPKRHYYILSYNTDNGQSELIPFTKKDLDNYLHPK